MAQSPLDNIPMLFRPSWLQTRLSQQIAGDNSVYSFVLTYDKSTYPWIKVIHVFDDSRDKLFFENWKSNLNFSCLIFVQYCLCYSVLFVFPFNFHVPLNKKQYQFKKKRRKKKSKSLNSVLKTKLPLMVRLGL